MTEHTTPKITSIRTGFLAGNLPDYMNPSRYAESLAAYLEAEYPGAEIEVPWQANASGAIPAPLQTAVTLDDPEAYTYDAEQDVEEAVRVHFEQASDDPAMYDEPETVQMIASRPWEDHGLVEYAGDGEQLEGWIDATRDDYMVGFETAGVKGWEGYTAIVELVHLEDGHILHYLVTPAALRAMLDADMIDAEFIATAGKEV